MGHAELMRWVCLIAVVLLCSMVSAVAGSSAPQVFLRVNIQTAGEGQSPLEVMSMNLPPNNEEILVRRLPEVTEKNLIGVQQDASGAVHLQFNHEGQVNLSAVTAQNQDRIMVVTVNGYVVYAPVIDEQITNGELVLPHQLTPALIQQLQETAARNVLQASKT